MGYIKRLLLLIIAVSLCISLFAGCRKEVGANGVESSIIDRGPFDYPENMPAASRRVPQKESPTKGYLSASVVDLTFNVLMTVFSIRLDSWYRVTIDRSLSRKEAEKISGFDKSGGSSNTFFEATIWYDYVRQQKMEDKIIIRQGGTKERFYEDELFFSTGESYIALLSKQFDDWDFVDTFGYRWTFIVTVDDNKERACQYTEGLPEFSSCQVKSSKYDQYEYFVYDIDLLVTEFLHLFEPTLNENDKYYMPTCDEYLREFRYNRDRFAKEFY